MKGILFNLAEEVVERTHGAEVWERMLDASGVDGAYTSLGNYPDSEFAALATAAAGILGVPEDAVVRSIAQGAIPLLVDRYPTFFEGHRSAKEFVLTLNEIIHPEVRKLYPGVYVPEFEFNEGPDGSLIIGYSSPRRLCALAEGFIIGAATHFGEVATITQSQCMLEGASACELHCNFAQAS